MSPESSVGAPPAAKPPEYQKKDFVSNQTVRWCPGCGDYAILDSVQKTFAGLGIPREQFCIVSGIGCSSRFPYYMNTYGFHTIHGRAPAVATGLKVTRPDLSVWVVTGDGDALSIGGNHILHAMRRNVDLKVLLFNNKIYGLTKGQFSPTSEVGKKTKTSPYGSIDRPLHPISVALAAEATFVARTADVYGVHLRDVLVRAAAHKGSAFIEILQNCLIFNDGAFDDVTNREIRDDHRVELAHGKPLIFGRAKDRGIRLNGMHPEVVKVGPDGVPPEALLVHDERNPNPGYAYMLSQMEAPDFPVPVGVFREQRTTTYEEAVHDQIRRAKEGGKAPDLAALLREGDTWVVANPGEVAPKP
ncbi:MAG TPA: 2-oxoacid:ferredoxin oxidoreductase subunit beta [Planctomycetota bacterium]|nr:2-oxoacid:ferredoxin oxidoreductase subunit beta [Planctomycetota bacterium]